MPFWLSENFALSFQAQTFLWGLHSTLKFAQNQWCWKSQAPPGKLQHGLHSQPWSIENGVIRKVISISGGLCGTATKTGNVETRKVRRVRSSTNFMDSWNLLEYRGTPRPSLPSRTGGHRSWMFGLTLPLQNNELPMKHDFHWHDTVVLMLFRCVFCLWLFHLSQFEKLWQLWVSNGCRKGPVCRTSSRQADPQQSWFSQSLPVPFPIYFPNQAKLAQTTDYWFPFGVSSQKFLASQDRQEIQPNTPLELQNPWQLRQEAQTVRRTSDKSFWQEPLLDLHATSEKISQDTHRRTF